MKKVYRATQVLLVILFIAIIMVSSYSTTAVNVLGIIGMAVSLFYIFLHKKLKKDYVQDSHVKEILVRFLIQRTSHLGLIRQPLWYLHQAVFSFRNLTS